MPGLLTELREAAPLAERLAKAAEAAEQHFGKAVAAAEAPERPEPPPRPPGSQPPVAPVGPQFAPEPKAPPSPGSPTRGTGKGDAAGGRLAPAQQVVSGNRQLSKPLDWILSAPGCVRRDPVARIPRPGNRNAVAENDYVEIGGWDCTAELHREDAIFYDPAQMAELLGTATTRSAKGSGGSTSPGPGRAARPKIQSAAGIDFPTFTQTAGFGESRAPESPGPPPTDPGVKRALDEQTKLLREIRDQGRIGDASLAQRVGGRP